MNGSFLESYREALKWLNMTISTISKPLYILKKSHSSLLVLSYNGLAGTWKEDQNHYKKDQV